MTLSVRCFKKRYDVEFSTTNRYVLPETSDGRVQMIARVRRFQLHSARLEAYKRFEQTRCLPMLRRQPGFLGGLFLRENPERALTFTLWEDRGAVDALKSSRSYQKVVHKMIEGRFLTGEALVEVWEVHGGEFRADALLQLLEELYR